jgi:TonB-dependent starch-binding outer membrane protein SusC
MNNGATGLFVSGSYEKQQGGINNSGLKRLTGRVNLSQKFFEDKLRLDLMSTLANVKDDYAPNTNSLIGNTITYNPTNPIHASSGGFFDKGDGSRNPAATLDYFSDNDNINRLLSNLSVSYEIVKGLTIKSTVGLNNSDNVRKSFADPRIPSLWNTGTTTVFGVNYNNPINGNGRAVYQHANTFSYLNEETITFDKILGRDRINAMGGYSYQSFETNNYSDVAWGLSTPVTSATDPFPKDINNFINRDVAYVPSSNKYLVQSYFGRINYTIRDKYYFTGIVRVDGSSKYGTSVGYGTFPGILVKWKILNEPFAENSIKKIFSDLNVRANWGMMGNQNEISPTDAIDYSQTWIPRGQSIPTTILIHQGSSNLKWEAATTIGFGLDWATMNSKLAGTVDYFYNQRKDLVGPSFTNLAGTVLNSGLEVSLRYNAIVKSKFSWGMALNVTFLHNEVKDLSQPLNTGAVGGPGLTGLNAQRIVNESPLFTWRMPVFKSFDSNGYSQYESGGTDQNVGSALPKFTAGLTNNLRYGNWNLFLLLTSSRGFYVYNNTANAILFRANLLTAHNVTYDVASNIENPRNAPAFSSRFLEAGDFIRLSNAQLGYNFRVNGKRIKSLSANLTGQNLFLITKYSGTDPEVNADRGINGISSRGIDYMGYPKARTFSLGLNIGF